MKIAILLKNGPGTYEAERALQTAVDMQAQDHFVSLYLLQEAVRFCRPGMKYSNLMGLKDLIEKDIKIHVLTQDAELRGIHELSNDLKILDGSYDSLVDLMVSCDQVVGIL